MAEFSIIERFCQGIGKQHNTTRLSVGDDAAIVSVPEEMDMAVSVDTMVEGVHFYPDTDPGLIAHKLMAVNLSDMAAMGARPKWATLALSIPDNDEQWLQAFSASLDSIATDFGVQLIGGDTTKGTLTLSITIMGLLPKGKALSRSDAHVGDDVYLSNSIGDAALALACINGDIKKKSLNLDVLKTALDTPEPQVKLGMRLLNVAHSCIDVSDGLVADAGHIAEQSKVSLEINVEQLPLSEQYQYYVTTGGDADIALSGGDDYQLLFTAPTARRGEVKQLSDDLSIPLTRIGKVKPSIGGANVVKLVKNNESYRLVNDAGYQHFRDDS